MSAAYKFKCTPDYFYQESKVSEEQSDLDDPYGL